MTPHAPSGRESVPQSVLDRLQQQMAGDEEDEAVVEEEDAELARQAKPQFVDSRPFLLPQGQQQQGLRLSGVAQKTKFEMPQFFSKEQAMLYHVEAAGVQLEQRSLRRYFAPYSSRMADELERQAALESVSHQKPWSPGAAVEGATGGEELSSLSLPKHHLPRRGCLPLTGATERNATAP